MYLEDSRASIVVMFLQTWLRALAHTEDGGGKEEGFYT